MIVLAWQELCWQHMLKYPFWMMWLILEYQEKTHFLCVSGLGTSSILAGAVMASLLQTAGKSCDPQGLIHLVGLFNWGGEEAVK
ncbi:hypothetical protein DPMN_104190 [Dreissena polymorpha]|uniref:Uncharacterized protein n=1 Tax=Dreissena polymorpha TaxID=45954 RepID=A0A9D4H9A8_DREPO|nr:hypothetical protein DPMN_104190 [Dreissena polymorpha]